MARLPTPEETESRSGDRGLIGTKLKGAGQQTSGSDPVSNKEDQICRKRLRTMYDQPPPAIIVHLSRSTAAIVLCARCVLRYSSRQRRDSPTRVSSSANLALQIIGSLDGRSLGDVGESQVCGTWSPPAPDIPLLPALPTQAEAGVKPANNVVGSGAPQAFERSSNSSKSQVNAGTRLSGFVAPASPLINGPKAPPATDAGKPFARSEPPAAVPTDCPPATDRALLPTPPKNPFIPTVPMFSTRNS